MHWMSVKLPDNFQMDEHSWPCRSHINGHTRQKTTKTNITQKHNTENYNDEKYMNWYHYGTGTANPSKRSGITTLKLNGTSTSLQKLFIMYVKKGAQGMNHMGN
jgi:hypothetical protein